MDLHSCITKNLKEKKNEQKVNKNKIKKIIIIWKNIVRKRSYENYTKLYWHSKKKI